DGIRDFHVTGVQTCALPIWMLYIEGTMEDITDRKKMEKALLESEERYRTAIEHSNDGVVITLFNEHLYVNRRYVEMFGYESPERSEERRVGKECRCGWEVEE